MFDELRIKIARKRFDKKQLEKDLDKLTIAESIYVYSNDYFDFSIVEKFCGRHPHFKLEDIEGGGLASKRLRLDK